MLRQLLCCCAFLLATTQATILVLSTNETYLDRSALFGPPLDTIIVGNLSIPESSRFGCTPVDPPPMDHWIALVERGHCSFADKVRMMQQSSAEAVVIGDPHFNGWITMYATGETEDIQIPSVYVAQYEFRELQAIGDQPVQLIKNKEIRWSFTDMMVVIVLSPSIMLFIVYFAWKCREYQRRIRDLAPCHVVASLPSYRREKSPMVGEECAICLEQYLENERIRTLPCRHEFHVHCIDVWLTTRKKFCPICKYNICQGIPQVPHISEQTPLLPR